MLMLMNRGTAMQSSAGALVAANWVVTAAHCVSGGQFGQTVSTVANMAVVLGEHDVSSSNDAGDTKR